MSPGGFYSGYALVRFVNSVGGGNSLGSVSRLDGVRPTINVVASAFKYGDGTMNNPYRMTE